MRSLLALAFGVALGFSGMARAAQEQKVLLDFESPDDVRPWSMVTYDPKTEASQEQRVTPDMLSDQHVTHGQHSLKVPGKSYLRWEKTPDLSGFDALDVDIYVEGEDPVSMDLVVGDKAWATHPNGANFNNRHNSARTLRPGANTVSIPVLGLFRGELGNRFLDIKTPIDPAQIVRFDMGFTPAGQRVTAIYVDNFRLVKETVPEGIQAFQFGPENQSVFPGFKPISWNTVHSSTVKAGLFRSAAAANRAQADTFPTRLWGAYVDMGDSQFVADVPNGQYRVWAVFNDTGEWDWFVAKFRNRWIESDGKRVYTEDRGPEGPVDYLYRFENIEPRLGDSMWDLYLKHMFKVVRFDVTVSDGQLRLAFNADAPWSCKLTSLVLFPKDKEQVAETWLSDIEARNKEEFDKRCLCLGPKPQNLAVPADAQAKGWWLGFPELTQNITFTDAPGQATANLSRLATRGEPVSYTFAVRPLRDLGLVTMTATDLKGPAGSIAAANLELRYAHHATQRGFADIAYTIAPETLRKVEGSGLKLDKDLTRQFLVAVNVPEDAAAGRYTGEVSLSAGDMKVTVPITLEVLGLKLDQPTFLMGFYGSWAPLQLGERQQQFNSQAFKLLKRGGMNSYSGGPDIPFSGFDTDGKPKLDFAACDVFLRTAREAGFVGDVYDYGGPGAVVGLHGDGVIGDAGRRWEKETGKPFKEILRLVWNAVQDHAQKEKWPVIYHSFVDEPRVLEFVQQQVELLKAYAEVAPQVKAGGYYSVDWDKTDPLHKGIQEMFKTLTWSGLNVHSQQDLDKAKEFGREIHVYNQGYDRYSFGAYQFAEMRKGVKGRIQWHALALYGYQFLSIDGREPDTAMYNFGRNEVIPTLRFYRIREGAWDFRYADTLWKLAQQKKGNVAADQAIAFLDKVNQDIGVAQRQRPQGFMDDETFRQKCAEYLKGLQAQP